MIFAVDGGGTTFKTALVNERGDISHAESFRLDYERGIGPLRESLSGIFQRRATEARLEGFAIEAVGIGCRGIIDPVNLVLLTDSGIMNFFSGHSFRELIDTDLPMAVENDAVAATLGEARFGLGARMKDFILLTLGTGIGGGIIIDGKIYKGHTGMAGHLGHLPVNPDGVRCGCGNIGCVETEFSAGAFQRKIGLLNSHRSCAPPVMDTQDLFRRAEAGDDAALEVVRGSVFFLAQAISGYANALDPERVVLSGGITQAGPFLMRLIIKALEPVLWRKDPREFVVFSPLGSRMGLCGAGAVGALALEARRS